MLVSEAALQREAIHRPLVLNVDRVEAGAVAELTRDVLSDRRWRTAQEGVADHVRVADRELLLHLVGRLISDFHAVRTGDIRHRRPPHVVLLIVAKWIRRRAVSEVRYRHVIQRRVDQFGDGDDALIGAGAGIEAPAAVER
jgi:hypothetical protein